MRPVHLDLGEVQGRPSGAGQFPLQQSGDHEAGDHEEGGNAHVTAGQAREVAIVEHDDGDPPPGPARAWGLAAVEHTERTTLTLRDRRTR